MEKSPNGGIVGSNKNDVVESLIKEITDSVRNAIASSSVFDILKTYSASSQNKKCISERNQANGRIVQLKDELRGLYAIHNIIEKAIQENVVQPRLEELSACFDSSSPLLSLGDVPISHVLGFLDEGDLHNCEQASYTINEIAHKKNGPWEHLYLTRRQNKQILHDAIPKKFNYDSKWFYRPTTFGFRKTTSYLEQQPRYGKSAITGNARIFNSRKFGWLAEQAQMYEKRVVDEMHDTLYWYVSALNFADLEQAYVMGGAGSCLFNRPTCCFLRLSYCRHQNDDITNQLTGIVQRNNSLVWQGYVSLQNIDSDLVIVIEEALNYFDKKIEDFQSFRNIGALDSGLHQYLSPGEIARHIYRRDFESIQRLILESDKNFGGVPVEQIIQGIQIMSDIKLTLLNPNTGEIILATGGTNGDSEFRAMKGFEDQLFFLVESKLTLGVTDGSRLTLKFDHSRGFDHFRSR